MITCKSEHNLLVVKNISYVIGCGREICELFENVCKKFIVFKFPHFINLNRYVTIRVSYEHLPNPKMLFF